MKIILRSLLILITVIPISIHAIQTDNRCLYQNGEQFEYGSGTFFDPYLICNLSQFTRLSKEEQLLQYYYILGKDLSFKNIPFPIIASESSPFTGGFNGNGYTLSNIKLTTNQSRKYIAVFAHTKGAQLRNIQLDNVLLEDTPSNIVGSLVGLADSTTLLNVHVKNIDLKAPDSSGGMIGILKNSLLVFASADGKLRQHFGTDASGGLIGKSEGSRIFRSGSKVDLVTTSKSPFGVSYIGGLCGIASQSNFTDVFARGNVNYEFAEKKGPRYIGGLFGGIFNSFIFRAYYAGQINIKGDFIAGAIAISYNTSVYNVFWDKELSGILESDGGIGEETAQLKSVLFWKSQNFTDEIWNLIEGNYPDLKYNDINIHKWM